MHRATLLAFVSMQLLTHPGHLHTFDPHSSDRTVRLWQPALRAESILHLTTVQHTPSAAVATASGLSGVAATAASAGANSISGGVAAVEDASNPLFAGDITNVAFGYQGVYL